MSRDLRDLQDFMGQRLEETIARFEAAEPGAVLLPICTHRSMVEQARTFRRTRRLAEIQHKAAMLQRRGYKGLAELLMEVGPVGTAADLKRPHRTKAGPGESFHQYGLAGDCAPLVDGKIDWDAENPDWQLYGECAKASGLIWAGDWYSFKEFPHVQTSSYSNPLDLADMEPSDLGFPVLDGVEYKE